MTLYTLSIRRPVLAYGVLELAIALWAIALPYAIRAVRAVYLGWLGGLDALPETLGIARSPCWTPANTATPIRRRAQRSKAG